MKFAKFFLVFCAAVFLLPFLALAGSIQNTQPQEPKVEVSSFATTTQGTNVNVVASNIDSKIPSNIRFEITDKAGNKVSTSKFFVVSGKQSILLPNFYIPADYLLVALLDDNQLFSANSINIISAKGTYNGIVDNLLLFNVDVLMSNNSGTESATIKYYLRTKCCGDFFIKSTQIEKGQTLKETLKYALPAPDTACLFIKYQAAGSQEEIEAPVEDRKNSPQNLCYQPAKDTILKFFRCEQSDPTKMILRFLVRKFAAGDYKFSIDPEINCIQRPLKDYPLTMSGSSFLYKDDSFALYECTKYRQNESDIWESKFKLNIDFRGVAKDATTSCFLQQENAGETVLKLPTISSDSCKVVERGGKKYFSIFAWIKNQGSDPLLVRPVLKNKGKYFSGLNAFYSFNYEGAMIIRPFDTYSLGGLFEAPSDLDIGSQSSIYVEYEICPASEEQKSMSCGKIATFIPDRGPEACEVEGKNEATGDKVVLSCGKTNSDGFDINVYNSSYFPAEGTKSNTTTDFPKEIKIYAKGPGLADAKFEAQEILGWPKAQASFIKTYRISSLKEPGDYKLSATYDGQNNSQKISCTFSLSKDNIGGILDNAVGSYSIKKIFNDSLMIIFSPSINVRGRGTWRAGQNYEIDLLGVDMSGELHHPKISNILAPDNFGKFNQNASFNSIYAVFEEKNSSDPICYDLYINELNGQKPRALNNADEDSTSCFGMPVKITKPLACDQVRLDSINVSAEIKANEPGKWLQTRAVLSKSVVGSDGAFKEDKVYSKWHTGIGAVVLNDDIKVSEQGFWNAKIEVRFSEGGEIFNLARFNSLNKGTYASCEASDIIEDLQCSPQKGKIYCDVSIKARPNTPQRPGGPNISSFIPLEIFCKKGESLEKCDVYASLFSGSRKIMEGRRQDFPIFYDSSFVNAGRVRVTFVIEDGKIGQEYCAKVYQSKTMDPNSGYKTSCAKLGITPVDRTCQVANNSLAYDISFDDDTAWISDISKAKSYIYLKGKQNDLGRLIWKKMESGSGYFTSKYDLGELEADKEYCFGTKVYDSTGKQIDMEEKANDVCCRTPQLMTEAKCSRVGFGIDASADILNAGRVRSARLISRVYDLKTGKVVSGTGGILYGKKISPIIQQTNLSESFLGVKPMQKYCFEVEAFDKLGQKIPYRYSPACCTPDVGFDFQCSSPRMGVLRVVFSGNAWKDSSVIGSSYKIIGYKKGSTLSAKDAFAGPKGRIQESVSVQMDFNKQIDQEYCFSVQSNIEGSWKAIPGIKETCCKVRSKNDELVYEEKGGLKYIKVENTGNSYSIAPYVAGNKFSYGGDSLSNIIGKSKAKYGGSGTFFSIDEGLSQPEAFIAKNGKLLRIYNQGAAFCQKNDGSFEVAKLRFTLAANVRELSKTSSKFKTVIIAMINSTNKGITCLYTEEWGKKPTAMSNGAAKYVSISPIGKIEKISDDPLDIPKGGSVIVFDGIGLERFDCKKHPSDCIKSGYSFDFYWTPRSGNEANLDDWRRNCQTIISGYPRILNNGTIDTISFNENEISRGLSGYQTSRSAIGVIDKNIMVLVNSQNVTMGEFATKLRGIGVRSAINTDGSGSAFLINKGKIEGYYDGRTLTNILLIEPRK